MEDNGVEVWEATPSPKGIEGDLEAMAERGLEGKGMNGEVPQERGTIPEAPKEGFQTDEAAADQDEGGQGDPPSQAEPESEIPAGIEAEAPAVFELEGEPAQGETELHIDSPLLEFEAKADAAPEEIKPETELDAAMSEPVTDATPDTFPDEIKADTDVGLDEVESAILERGSVLDAAPIGSESGMDESSVAAASADIESEIDKVPVLDEFNLETDTAPAEVEIEVGEPLVEVKPDADATPYIELEMNDAPDDVPVEAEPETDGTPAESKPEIAEAQVEELETAAPVDIEPETEVALMERELETDEAPTDVEADVEKAEEPETDGAPAESKPESEEAQVEELETAAPVKSEPEIVEALMERELETDAAPMDVEAEVEKAEEPEMDGAPAESKPEAEEAQVEELETAAPVDIEPETEEAPMDRELEIDAAPTDVEAEVEKALAERELENDAAPVNYEPETDAAAADIEAGTDTAQKEIDASPDEIPSEIDAASPKNETVEIELVVNAALVEVEQDEVSQAEIEAPPEPEPALVEGEPEVNAEDVDNSAEIEAKTEPPQETEPEPKPLDAAEDTSLQPLQEIESESEVVAIDEAKPEDETLVETKGEERGPVETESDQQDLVEGEVEIEPEPAVETSRGIELEAEAEVPLEDEPEPVAEAPEPDETGHIEMVSDQQDFVEIEPDQSGVKEHDRQLQKQEGEEDLGELDTSVSEDNQSSESQPQVADASEVPVMEDEPPAIIEQEPEEGNDFPPSATGLEGEGESTIEGVSDNQDSGVDVEQSRGTAVDNEQGAVAELLDESKEDINEQERTVDAGRDEGGAVLASAGNGGETKESSEQELAIERLPADVVDVEESAKEDISEQVRALDAGHDEDGAVLASAGIGGEVEVPSEQELAIDVGHDGDGAVLASAGNGGEVEVPREDWAVLASAGNGGEVDVPSEQELGIELPPADVVHVEESAKEGPPPSDQEQVTEQPQPLIDEQDLSIGLGAAAHELPSVESDESLNATLPSSESEMTSDAPEPHDEAVTSEHEFNLESACGELERDIGEEEAASSTVAEAGSVLNDFDERSSYEHELPTDFPSTDQDVDIADCKDFDDNLSSEGPESIETGLREHLDFESAEAAKPAEDLHSVLVEEVSSDEHLSSLPKQEQVVQDSGEDKIHLSKEVLAVEELRNAEEERDACEDDKVVANSIFGTSLPIIAGDELISKALTYLENGRQSFSSSEGPSKELVQHKDESSDHQSEANNTDKAEIHAMETKGMKETEHNPMGGDTNNDADEAVVASTSIPEERDIKGVQAFRQESTQEASLPVVILTQDRALEHVSLKSAERPSGGGTLERRTKLLGCCGMFDLLLRKN